MRKNVHSWEWLVCKTQGLVMLNPCNNWYCRDHSVHRCWPQHWRTGSQGPSLCQDGCALLAAGRLGGLGSRGWKVGDCWTHRGYKEERTASLYQPWTFTGWFRGGLHQCVPATCLPANGGRSRGRGTLSREQSPLGDNGPSQWAERWASYHDFCQNTSVVICSYVDFPFKILPGGSILMLKR